MRFLLHLLIFVLMALGVGFGLSYLALEKGGLFGTLQVGPWLAWTQIGDPRPDPYTQAYASRTGALELARAEGIKFVAIKDSDGNDLRRKCSYRIYGNTPEAAFWTLGATQSNGTSVTREGAGLVMHSARINRAPDGLFKINVGPVPAGGNWLEISGSGNFMLVLTLYDSSIFSGFGTQGDTLPAIFLDQCND